MNMRDLINLAESVGDWDDTGDPGQHVPSAAMGPIGTTSPMDSTFDAKFPHAVNREIHAQDDNDLDGWHGSFTIRELMDKIDSIEKESRNPDYDTFQDPGSDESPFSSVDNHINIDEPNKSGMGLTTPGWVGP